LALVLTNGQPMQIFSQSITKLIQMASCCLQIIQVYLVTTNRHTHECLKLNY